MYFGSFPNAAPHSSQSVMSRNTPRNQSLHTRNLRSAAPRNCRCLDYDRHARGCFFRNARICRPGNASTIRRNMLCACRTAASPGLPGIPGGNTCIQSWPRVSRTYPAAVVTVLARTLAYVGILAATIAVFFVTTFFKFFDASLMGFFIVVKILPFLTCLVTIMTLNHGLRPPPSWLLKMKMV